MSLGLDPAKEPEVMNIDEYITVTHLMNLLFEEMHEIAKQLIQNYLTCLDLCSPLFRGNVSRIHALCMQPVFEEKIV